MNPPPGTRELHLAPLESLSPAQVVARHRHAQAYVAVVLSGWYEEAGDDGRWHAGPGDALFHDAMHAHFDQVGSAGASVLNIPVSGLDGLSLPPVFRIENPDALLRKNTLDAEGVVALLRPLPGPLPLADWPDLLARALADNDRLHLGNWAGEMGLAPATVSRGFRSAYGTSPVRYRAELRAKRALRQIRTSDVPLAAIAHDCGFADQAHLGRAIASLTGFPPGAWRTRVKSVQ